MHHILDRRVAAWFGAATALSLALAAALYIVFGQLSDRATWVGHTQEVLLELRSLAALIDEATVSARGFALTGEERFNSSQAGSRPRVDGVLRRIRDLTGDNPSQWGRLDELEPLVADRARTIEAIVALRRTRGLEPVIQLLRAGPAERQMDRIHRLIAAMEAEENHLLEQRLRATTEASRRTLAVFLAGLATNVLLLAWCFGHLGRQMRLRDRAEETLLRSERQFRGIFEATDRFIGVLDPAGTLLEVNRSALEFAGAAREDVVGRPFAQSPW